MFFKKHQPEPPNPYNKELDSKLDAVYDACKTIDKLIPQIINSNNLIAILPSTPSDADLKAEQEYNQKLRYNLLCAIGNYDCRVMEYNDYWKANVDKITLDWSLWNRDSHEYMRHEIENYWKYGRNR